jgi:hypothetical protein
MAHHAGTAYDAANQISISGTVKEFRWTNPHTWIYLSVTDAAGQEQQWKLEGTSLVVLARLGWRANVLKAGDKVTARIAPAKTGDTAGVFSQVTILDSGKVLAGGLGPPSLPPLQSGVAPAATRPN